MICKYSYLYLYNIYKHMAYMYDQIVKFIANPKNIKRGRIIGKKRALAFKMIS